MSKLISRDRESFMGGWYFVGQVMIDLFLYDIGSWLLIHTSRQVKVRWSIYKRSFSLVAIYSLYYYNLIIIIIIEVGYFTLKLQEALQSSFGLLNHLCQSSSIFLRNNWISIKCAGGREFIIYNQSYKVWIFFTREI